MELIRCFFCLPLAQELRDQVAQWIAAARQRQPRFRWVAPQTLHVTLRFCGEIPPIQLVRLRELVAQRRQAPFQLTLGAVTPFGGSRPRGIWVGLSAGGGLTELQRFLEGCCREAGLEPEERPFAPHLTLARIAPGRPLAPRWLEALPIWSLAGQSWIPSEWLLLRSRLTPQGPRYGEVERYSFSPIP